MIRIRPQVPKASWDGSKSGRALGRRIEIYVAFTAAWVLGGGRGEGREGVRDGSNPLPLPLTGRPGTQGKQ